MFKGNRQDAQRELTRLLAAADAGTLPEPSKTTVAEHVRDWIKNDPDLSPKTAERYCSGIGRCALGACCGAAQPATRQSKALGRCHRLR
jgi:hypothetical protein